MSALNGRADTVDPFVHEALFYANDEQYVAGLLPFLEDGLAAGEPALVAVPHRNGELLRGGLGSAADEVRFLDMTVAGRNPGRIIPTVLLAFVAEHAGQRVRIIGEPIWPGRTDTEYGPCVQHEALINLAVAGKPATIVCPYDTVGLAPSIIADAEGTHPILDFVERKTPSTRYLEPAAMAAAFNKPLPEPDAPTATVVFRADGLGHVRNAVADYAHAAGLPADRTLALQLAVNELAANTITHTAGPGTLRIWREPGQIVCEVRDSGRITDALFGRRPPSATDDLGRGLLLVNYFCDLVQVHTDEASTTVRIRLTA